MAPSNRGGLSGPPGADYPAQISAPYTEGRAAKSLAIFWPGEPGISGGGADYPAWEVPNGHISLGRGINRPLLPP